MNKADMEKLREKRKELTNVAARMFMGKEKNLKKAKNLRKEIAQLLSKAK